MIKGKNKDTSNSNRVYRILPNFNTGCKNCSLFNNQAIGGHSFGKIDEVELIIVAAYPAMEEVKKGYSLASNEKKENIDRLNAGRYVEYSIKQMFDLDSKVPAGLKPFYNKIAFTNIIKCTPFSKSGQKIDVKDRHIKTCKQTWLEKEIQAISSFNPTCPILLCGSEAAKLLAPKQKVYSSRRTVFTYNNTHPTVITFNPVEAVRYTSYEISESRINSKDRLLVNSIKPEKPIIIGSTTWHWKQDIELIKKLVLENYSNRNHDNSK
jgi:hypothetical protein